MAYYREGLSEEAFLQEPVDNTACRMCLEVDPADDRIKPCACSGSVALVHRKCLDRWRTLSPHPDALWSCELCKTQYKLVFRQAESELWRKSRYILAILADLLVLSGVVVGLYLLAGFLGDLSFNHLMIDLFCKYRPVNGTPDCPSLPFILEPNIWEGRIWFYGFIVFFFFLGLLGCCIACCFKDEGTGGEYGHSQFRRGDCWWLCCGPSHYAGYYYYSPYGYWGWNDIFCLMCLDMHMHHHGCNLHSCQQCGHGANCDAKPDSLVALLVIVAIIVAIFVAVGVVFGTILGVMIVGKVIRRHVNLLEKRADATTYIVADLNNPAQVAEADRQQNSGLQPLRNVVVDEPETLEYSGQPPKGKGFDYSPIQ